MHKFSGEGNQSYIVKPRKRKGGKDQHWLRGAWMILYLKKKKKKI